MILLRTLGDCSIEIGDVRLAPDSEILFSLLAYLIVERGRPIPRSVLIDFFWEAEEESKARHCLRQSIYKLRRMGVPIETRNDRYYVQQESALADYDALEQSTLHPLPIEDSMLCVLPGFVPAASRKYSDWIEELRDKCTRAIRLALLQRMAQARRSNDWRIALRLSGQCLVLDPLNEEATLIRAESLAMTGDKSRALCLLSDYAADVGVLNSDLRIPAKMLHRRISEGLTIPSSGATRQPFIGREESIHWLSFLALQVSRGNGATCLIRGAPGLGKSRLASEFANSAAIKGFRTVRVECRSTSSDRALSIFMELIPQLLKLPGALGCSPKSLGFVRRLAEHTPDTTRLEQSSADARTLHDNIRESVLDLIDALAMERPLIIVIEDIHRIDGVSASVLREIARSNERRALLVILTARPDDRNDRFPVDTAPFVMRHELRPLSEESARELANELCAGNSGETPPDVLDWCVSHGNGNPLFITELVRHWRDTRDTLSVPASLDLLLDERLSHLSSAALRALQVAALLGPHCSYEHLEQLLNFPRWKLLEAVEELAIHGLTLPTLEGISTGHELISGAAIRRLSRVAESFLHSAIARCLEASDTASRDSATLWDAATHWSLAGDRRKAVMLAQQCAQHLMSVGLPHEASELLRKALGFAKSDAERLQIYSARRVPLRGAACWEGLLENASAARLIENAYAQTSATVHSDFELDFYEAHCVEATSEGANVIKLALTCAEDNGASIAHRIAAASFGLAACYSEGDRGAATRFVKIVTALSPTEQGDKRNSLVCQLIFHIEYGSLSEACRLGDALLEQALREDDPRLSRYLRLSTYAHRVLGHFEIVVDRLAQARDFAHANQILPDYCEALSSTVQYYCSTEEFDLAWRFVLDLMAVFRSRPYLVLPVVWHSCAEVALMRGDAANARIFLERTHGFPTKALRPAGDRLALNIACNMATGGQPTSAQVDELLEIHLKIRCYAGQDFPTGVLCSALALLGRETQAVITATEYLQNHRREHWLPRHAALLKYSKTEFKKVS